MKGKKQEGPTREAMMEYVVLGLKVYIELRATFVLDDSSTVHRIDNVGAGRHHRLLRH